METLDAFRDHGNVAETLTQNIGDANQAIEEMEKIGIDIDKITKKLENEGIEKFNGAYEKLLKSINEQKRKF